MANELVEMVARNAAKYGEREALRFQDYKTQEWVSISWKGFKNQVDRMALSLEMLGIEAFDKIAIFSQNCPGIMVSHMAAFYNRATTVPIYATCSKDEVAFIVTDSAAKVLFVGDQRQYEVALRVAEEVETLKNIVLYNPTIKLVKGDTTTLYWDDFLALSETASDKNRANVLERKNAGDPEDLAFLIYTSGTTGKPKGVMLTHANFDIQLEVHRERITQLREDDVSLSFLPMSHVFELAWSLVVLSLGMHLVINYNPKEIQKTIKEIHPTCMCAVPRFWEKVYAAVIEKMHKSPLIMKKLMKEAITVGIRRNVVYVGNGKKVPTLLEKRYQILDKLVLSKVREAIGIRKATIYPTAGAALSDNITAFLRGIDLPIYIGYGLSETTATVSFFPDMGYKIGSVGTKLRSLDVKIGENNEILVKGPSIMKGYYNRPEENAAAFTEDGYFRTGDAGHITENGDLVLTERLKDLFKTSNGKYIAPQALETLLGEDSMIEQVAVIGEQRKFVTALVVPAYDAVMEYANKNKIGYDGIEDLLKNPAIIEMFMQNINQLQSNFASYQQIKRITLLPRPFSMVTGELTNTLKVRRAVVAKIYSKEIEAMYAY